MHRHNSLAATITYITLLLGSNDGKEDVERNLYGIDVKKSIFAGDEPEINGVNQGPSLP
jgi:hypothetical protein